MAQSLISFGANNKLQGGPVIIMGKLISPE